MEEKILDEFEQEVFSSANFPVREFKRGGTYKVKIVKVDDDFLLVDVGRKSEAFIPKEEIDCNMTISLKEQFEPGKEIVVKAIRGGGPTEGVVLSNKRAADQVKIDKIEEKYNNQEDIESVVKERIKGGLSVELDRGIRAFLPATLVSIRRDSNLEKYVGQNLPVKIIEFDRRNRKIVVSHRLIEEEEMLKKQEEILSTIQVGEILDGTITRVVDYGAFVDIGYGLEGLVHVSELSWREGIKPSDVVRKKDKIKVRVIGISDDKDRISLSYKRTLPDPWEKIVGKYKLGDIVEGKVVKDLNFGAIVELEEGINAFIHISQLSNKRINNINDILSEGDIIKTEIIEIDIPNKRIKLSRKNLLPKEEEIQEESHNQNTGDNYSDYVDVFIPKDAH